MAIETKFKGLHYPVLISPRAVSELAVLSVANAEAAGNLKVPHVMPYVRCCPAAQSFLEFHHAGVFLFDRRREKSSSLEAASRWHGSSTSSVNFQGNACVVIYMMEVCGRRSRVVVARKGGSKVG